MLLKTLKHKELPDTFGSFMDTEQGAEIVHGSIPHLYPLTATKEAMGELLQDEEGPAFEQLGDYELVEIEVILPGETLAFDPLKSTEEIMRDQLKLLYVKLTYLQKVMFHKIWASPEAVPTKDLKATIDLCLRSIRPKE